MIGRRTRLSTRLILSVVLIEAVMLTVLVWNSVRLISSSHSELLEQATGEEIALLANALAPGLAANDRAMLLDVMSLIKDKKNLSYVMVHDRQGKVLVSTGEAHHPAQHDRNYRDALRDGIYDISYDIELAGQHLGSLHAGFSIERIEHLTQKTRVQNTAIAAVALGFSIVGTIMLGLFLTRNLRQLQEGARALERGELQYRIPLRGEDEISDVGRSFNRLAEHLSEMQDALHKEHAALERETKHLSTLLHGIDAVVWEADPRTHCFSFVSKEAQNLLGHPSSRWLEEGFWARQIHPEDVDHVMQIYNSHRNSPGTFDIDYRMMHVSGEYLWVRDISTLDIDADGAPSLRGLIIDITEQKRSEERIVYLADHDSLTGLINRRHFQEELERHIHYAARLQHEGALLFIDLDQFKYINDTLGHQAGDEYLNYVAQHLASALREIDVIGRLGGDEFGIILPKASAEEAGHVARHLLDCLSSLTEKSVGRYAPVSASIGIVTFPTHGKTISDLLAKADTAMYAAKERGRNCYHMFSDDAAELVHMHAKIHWEDRIRRALAEDRFVLFYQPVVNLLSGEIMHYEALLRMLGDDDELIPPGAFIDTAERFGLIREIDLWVLRKTIQTQAESRRIGTPMTLAVNLSGRHFGSSDVMEVAQAAIESNDADPRSLIFEVTETAAVENLGQARSFIDSLRSLGCRFALDDFGVGYASFHYLKNLPVDFIKIDGSFVRNLHNNELDQIFIKATSDLANGLGIVTIAEFVENQRIVDILVNLGVHLGQGYHLAKPQAEFLPSGLIELRAASH